MYYLLVTIRIRSSAGDIMSRHKMNIKMQLNRRIDELLRIGEKKTKEERDSPNYNSNRSEGIHSIRTADTYRRCINVFADYCKTQGIKRVEDIDESIVAGFVDQRRECSSWTISKDLAAINKVLNDGNIYTPAQFGIEPRYADNVVHNRRTLMENSTAEAERNQIALWFVHATGCRRSSVLTVTASQAIRDDDDIVIGFQFKEKGGRERNALLLPVERERMTEFVNAKIAESGEGCHLISQCDRNCNPHFERAHYCQDMYELMRQAKESGRDIYDGYRDIFINEEKYQHAIEHPRYSADFVRGYDTKILAELSQQLGHNRISVLLGSYLR